MNKCIFCVSTLHAMGARCFHQRKSICLSPATHLPSTVSLSSTPHPQLPHPPDPPLRPPPPPTPSSSTGREKRVTPLSLSLCSYRFVILCDFESVINNLYVSCFCRSARTDCKTRLLPKISVLEF